MKCEKCGKKCDLIDTRLIVDTIQKEHHCLPCHTSYFLTKDSKGNHTIKDRSNKILHEWVIGNGI